MTAALAALLALSFLPTLVLDFPFTGRAALSYQAFEGALKQMPPHLKGLPPAGRTEN